MESITIKECESSRYDILTQEIKIIFEGRGRLRADQKFFQEKNYSIFGIGKGMGRREDGGYPRHYGIEDSSV